MDDKWEKISDIPPIKNEILIHRMLNEALGLATITAKTIEDICNTDCVTQPHFIYNEDGNLTLDKASVTFMGKTVTTYIATQGDKSEMHIAEWFSGKECPVGLPEGVTKIRGVTRTGLESVSFNVPERSEY